MNTTNKLNTIFFSIILLLSLVIWNSLSKEFNLKVDLTKNKLYSLSNSTKQLISDLDDTLLITLYTSKNLPAHISGNIQDIKDISREYQSLSPQKIRFIHKKVTPKVEAQLRDYNIPKLKMNIVKKDEFQAVDVYVGLTLMYKDKFESIPVALNQRNLEYEISLRVKKLLSDQIEKIAVISTTKETMKSISTSLEILEKQYTLQPYSYDDIIDPSIKTAIFYKPENLSSKNIFQIDQFIMRGNKALIIMDAFKFEGLQVKQQVNRMKTFLKHHGIGINEDLILDEHHTFTSFNSGYMNYTLPYPYWPKIQKEFINKNFAEFNQVHSMIFPWTSSISLLNEKNLNQTILISSSLKSWAQEFPFNLNPQQNFEPLLQKSHALVAQFQGKFSSMFSNSNYSDDQLSQTADATITVMTSSLFLNNRIINQYPSNLRFFLGLVDTLTQSSLSSIQPKGISDYPILPINPKYKLLLKLLATFLIPLLLIIIGVIRYVKRKALQ